MLGWEFFVTRQADAKASPALASWQASLGGLAWLENLVSKGMAIDLGGNGYPCRYVVAAGTITAMLAHGLPKHDGPPVFGSDYYLPNGWTGNAQVDMARLRSIDPNELLLVEAWDQS